MAFEGLNFDVGLNARPFTDGIKTMQSQAVSFDNTVKQIGRTLMGVFGTVSVVATLKKSIELWGEQEQAMMKLSIAAQRFTRDAQGTYDRVSKLSGNLQHLTGIGNETYQSVAALGLSLGITEEKIENATTAAALLSQVTGMDLNSAMKNLAKTQAGLTGELGEALPFLRELTQEQLRNGEAIDLVIKKYDGFAEQLSGTTQVAMKRFWSALGDVGEVLGKSFNPLIQKAADWMEGFSSKIEKPTDILKTLKDTIKAGYEELGPFGKAVVGLGATFLTLKVAGTAWSLLSQVVVAGGSLIVNAFKTIFSWPFLLIAGLYTLRVAWDHDWLGIRGAVSNAGEAISNVLESMGIHVEDFSANSKKAFADVGSAWKSLTEATNIDEFLQGIVDLGSEVLQIPAKILFGEDEKDSFKGKLANIITFGGLVSLATGKPLIGIGAAILSLGLTDKFRAEVRDAKGALEVIKLFAEEVYSSVATIGAGITDLLGGDSKKYLDDTTAALEKMQTTIKEIGETESITKKFDLSVELAEEIYQIPAKFFVSGFIDNFDQAWIDNAASMLAIIGITKFMGGSWRLAVGLALISDVILGDNVSSDGLVNSTVKSLEAGAATWMITKSGKLGLGVALVVMGWEAGKDFGEWLVSIGIGDAWDKWMKDTLGDFYIDTISGLKTDTFLDQLNASGIYMGLTILAGLKWPFDKLLDFTKWIGDAVNNALLGIYEAGLEIGNQLVDAIKYVFGGGWLLEMLGIDIGRTAPIDTSPGRSSGGREGNMPVIGGGGEGLRFKDDQTRMLSQLEGMYAMEGFPKTGIEIIASPLALDIREEIDAVLKKAVAYAVQQEESKVYAGVSVDPTTVMKPLMEKISSALIEALNMGLIDPMVLTALSYAETKLKIWEVEGKGKGPFQWEYGAFEDISTRWMRDTIPSTMTHTEAATEPTYAIRGSEYYLDWIKNYGEGALGSLIGALVGWNKGRSAAQGWVGEGSNIEDLQDSTKILLTNFMVGMEKFTEGDWTRLNDELLAEIQELADVVNSIIAEYPDVVKKSFPGEKVRMFYPMTPEDVIENFFPPQGSNLSVPIERDRVDVTEIIASADRLTMSIDELASSLQAPAIVPETNIETQTAIQEEMVLEQKEAAITLENLFGEFQTANSSLQTIINKLSGIRDLLWQRLPVTVTGKAEGGYISGPGGPTDDLIPAMLSDGEFVVNAKATERWLPFLKAINAQGFSMGGLAGLKKQIKGFATGGRAMAGESGVEPVTWWNVISNALKGVLGDFTETAKKDFGMLKDVFSDLLRTIGLDIDSSTQKMEDLVSQMEDLQMPAFKYDSSHMDFMVSLGLAARKIDAISSLLDETKLEKLNRQMSFIDAEMSALEKAFTEGEIGILEYSERIKYLSNISHNLGLSLEALNKKIERSSIVADASEIFKVDENGDLKSVFNELRPGMEGLTDVVGNLSVAGEMFAMSMFNQIMNLEAINMLLNPITTILSGVMEILGPIINLLKPLGDALVSIGRVFALTFNLFGQGLLILQPFFKALGWLGATISFVADQIVLFIDGIFTWLSGLPVIGWMFSPLLTEDQRQSMKRTIPERMEDIELPQSTTGQVFQAGSSQHITNNYHFEFRGNDILTEDDESARRFADLIYKNLRDRGVQLQVG